MDRRFTRREDGTAEGCAEQQHDFVPVSYHSELLEDMSEGLEPGARYRRDQEGLGLVGLMV